MGQRSAELVARIDGQNPISLISKDFAMAEHIGGVPLDELKILVGEKQTVMLAQDNDVAGFSVGETGYASPYTAFQPLTNFPTAAILRIADILHLAVDIRATGSLPGVEDGEAYGRFNFYLFADDWAQLTAASVGDTLNIGTGTGFLVRAMQEPHVSSYTPIGTVELLLGRTADNELLVQHHNDHVLRLRTAQIAATNNIGMSLAFEVYAGGMLASRIAALRAFDSTHRISVKGRFASLAAAQAAIATEPVTYDGLEPIIASGSSLVLARADDPAGNDPLWYFATTADFDHVYHTWEVDNQEWLIAGTDVSVVDTSVAFQVQFAETASGPWHVPRTDDDLWVRLREPDGTWRSFPFRAEDNRGWQLLTTQVFTDSSRWQRRLMGFRRTEFEAFVFECTNNDVGYAGERHWAILPAYDMAIQTVFTMAEGQTMQSRPDNFAVRFQTGLPTTVQRRAAALDTGSGTAFNVGFEREGSDPDLCGAAVFGRWTATTNFTFRLWGLRV